MNEAVSDIIAERAQLATGVTGTVSRMLLLSLAAHALLVAALIVAPEFFTGAQPEKVTPMMISLGGAEGPDSGGMNTISNRAIQREAEPDAKPERPTPPAPARPEMVLPDPKPAPKTPPKPVTKPAETSSTRKPSTGKEVAQGSGRVETPGAAQIPFGGLTTGGGGDGSARVSVANFCCPAYLMQVSSQIKRNWSNRQGLTGQNTVKFVIRRDGTLTDIEIETSGGQLLDLASMRALQVTRQVTGLPAEFTSNTLTVYLVFDYSR